MWRENDTVVVERSWRGTQKRKEYILPEDKQLAVDSSLLVLLRSFPFNKNEEWKIFMIDFSQYSVKVTVRQSGTEPVTVPAGTFDCYRIEVIVNFFIFRPRITYWLSKERPHFLVKHSGKRGPFTPSYIASLVAIEK
jgi:hypothetical protein